MSAVYFVVRGAWADNGRDGALVLPVASEVRARERASKNGLMVLEVECLGAMDDAALGRAATRANGEGRHVEAIAIMAALFMEWERSGTMSTPDYYLRPARYWLDAGSPDEAWGYLQRAAAGRVPGVRDWPYVPGDFVELYRLSARVCVATSRHDLAQRWERAAHFAEAASSVFAGHCGTDEAIETLRRWLADCDTEPAHRDGLLGLLQRVECPDSERIGSLPLDERRAARDRVREAVLDACREAGRLIYT